MSDFEQGPGGGSGGGGGGSTRAASPTYGTVSAVAPAATTRVASLVVASTAYRIRGFTATGNGDGLFRLRVAGTIRCAGRIMAASPSVLVPLSLDSQDGLAAAVGSTIALEVTCMARAAADFEGTILGEA